MKHFITVILVCAIQLAYSQNRSTQMSLIFNQGVYEYHNHNYTDASRLFRQVTTMDSTYADAYNYLGLISSDMGLYPQALQYYRKATHFQSKDVYLYNTGCAYDDLEQYDSAITYYTLAIAKNKFRWDFYYNRGWARIQLADYGSAITDLDSSIGLRADHASSYNNRGFAKNQLNQFESALADLEKAVQLNPNDLYAINNRANAYFGTGNVQKACEGWKEALLKGYEYKPEWKAAYGLEDPADLIKKYCTP